MKLYNTLDRQIQDFNPISPHQASIYTCGPTVYDYPHVGNWFTFIRYDLLVRTLRVQGFKTKWALNITDVGHLVSDADEGEDKLEKGARREGKSAQQVADFYTSYFIKGLKRLNFSNPDFLPRATEHINEQIEFIKELEHKGYTYVIDDGVYYDTSKFRYYSNFANLDLDEQQAGDRVDVNPQKKQPSDFALWKFSPKDKKRDMEWPSPWGMGFPGWHIECSAMIRKYFGDTIDIHSGGIDHIPVHHTNEIAQSQAVTGKSLANYWMHTNHILVDDEKIAKSTGNGITLEDIEARGFRLPAFRLLILQSHYRSQSAFSWETIQAAQNRLDYIQASADLRHQVFKSGVSGGLDLQAYKDQMLAQMANDLNTPAVLLVLNKAADELNVTDSLDEKEITDFFGFVDKLLGLDFLKDDISVEQKNMIQQRESARQDQDWVKADQLRSMLAGQGIEINDTASGPIWYRNS